MLTSTRTPICIVNPYEHGGGAEYQIALLIDVLADSGRYDIHYLTHFVNEDSGQRRYRVARVGTGGPVPRLGYIAEANGLYRLLSEIAPSIIYQRVACAYTGICALYSRRHGVPLLWHVSHDTEVTRQPLDKARNILRARLEKCTLESGIKHATAIVVQTQHQAELLKCHYSRQADAIIPNFHPAAAEHIDKSGPLTVVWIANLKPWKQPEIFVDLAKSLGSLAGVRFVMVGAEATGKQPWQEVLMQNIQGTANLQYIGKQSQSAVNDLLARAHIFVNTSVHEGFPNTFVQAWLRDVVVVSLQVDPDGVLESQRVGMAAHSQAGLVAAVRDLIEQPALRAAYAKRGREHAQAAHSLRNAEDLMNLMNSYMKQPAS